MTPPIGLLESDTACKRHFSETGLWSPHSRAKRVLSTTGTSTVANTQGKKHKICTDDRLDEQEQAEYFQHCERLLARQNEDLRLFRDIVLARSKLSASNRESLDFFQWQADRAKDALDNAHNVQTELHDKNTAAQMRKRLLHADLSRFEHEHEVEGANSDELAKLNKFRDHDAELQKLRNEISSFHQSKLDAADKAASLAQARLRNAQAEETAPSETWQKKQRRFATVQDGIEQGDEIFRDAVESLRQTEKETGKPSRWSWFG